MKKGDIIKKITLLGEPMTGEDAFEAQVVWVIDSFVSAQDLTDKRAYYHFAENDTDWKVIQESAPSFQSQVANMSDEDLRAAVNDMRGGRVHIPVEPKARKVREPKLSTEEKSLQALLAQMSPEDQVKLKQKLGIGA